jgi:hypothetical protein
MVGQTLRGQWRYYRCRRAFAGPKVDRCQSVYVRAEKLEASILAQVSLVLAKPEIIRAELMRRAAGNSDAGVASGLISRLSGIERQRERLLKLYQLGEVDDEYLHRESKPLTLERERIQEELSALETRSPMTIPEESDLALLCAAVASWVLDQGPEELPLILEALQLSVAAQRDSAAMHGVIPEYASLCNHADVRPVVT